jgi:DnaJ-class molecular chaperone
MSTCVRCYGTGIQFRPLTTDTLISAPCKRCEGADKPPEDR